MPTDTAISPSVEQLERALDLAVAREDLLDQRRARARQADDEDRRVRLEALARVLLEELAAEYRRDLFVAGLEPHGIVGHQRPLPLVAGVVELPGAVVVAGVLVRLAEGEAEMHVGARAQVLALHLLFHGRDFRRLEAEDLEIRHAPVHFAEVRLLRDGGRDTRAALPPDAPATSAHARSSCGRPGARLQRDRSRIGCGALLHVADLRVVRTEPRPGRGVVRLDLDGAPVAVDRFLRAVGACSSKPSRIQAGTRAGASSVARRNSASMSDTRFSSPQYACASVCRASTLSGFSRSALRRVEIASSLRPARR